MQIPITHYEFMKEYSKKFLGVTMEELTRVIGGDFDFMELKNYVETHPDIMGIYGMAGNEQLNTAVRMMYHIARMKIYGEKIYHMTSSVCDVIQSTKPTIDAEFIAAPFEEIYISLEQKDIILDDGMCREPMKGLYLSLRVETDGIRKLRFLATSGAMGINELKDVNHFACFNIPDHGNLDEIFKEQQKIFKQHPGGTMVADEVIYDIFKFAVGCLLYIGCRNANLLPIKPFTIEEAIKNKGPKKAKIIARRMQKISQSPYTYITHGSIGGGSTSTGNGKKLNHEVLVGGYWRGQWYGSDKTGDRRKEVIRIDSYTKGGGERINKPYIVK